MFKREYTSIHGHDKYKYLYRNQLNTDSAATHCMCAVNNGEETKEDIYLKKNIYIYM